MPQPRDAFNRFHRYSQAITNIIFEAQSDLTIDNEDILPDFENALLAGSMVVEFQKRGTYRYYGVYYTDYVNFKNASSWGEYFNENIKDQYTDYERIG